LNYIIEEFELLKMEVTFTQDIYKNAPLALEAGRMDATRTLKKVLLIRQ
jgi:capsular polysaccharide transport system permease protein